MESTPSRGQLRIFALASTSLSLVAGLVALYLNFTPSTFGPSPAVDVVLPVTAVSLSVAAASGTLVWFSSRRTRFASGLRVTETFEGLVVEQEARIVSDIDRFLRRLPPFVDVIMIGHAQTLLQLLEHQPSSFFGRSGDLRIVLTEREDALGSLRTFLRRRWRTEGSGAIRTINEQTEYALVFAGDLTFYELGLPGQRIREQQPWLLFSERRSGPLWLEWRDYAERLWRLAEPLKGP